MQAELDEGAGQRQLRALQADVTVSEPAGHRSRNDVVGFCPPIVLEGFVCLGAYVVLAMPLT